MNPSTETATADPVAHNDEARHRSTGELEAALPHIREAPSGAGTIQLIVRRPGEDAREVLSEARINADEGIEGDTWNQRGTSLSADGGPHPNMQITIMNSRVAAAIIGPIERWPLAGDQIYADLDISHEALPAGTQLSVGDAVLEVAVEPHAGCAKYAARFGREALRFVNTGEGPDLRLRGVNCRVIQPGTVRIGDSVSQIWRGRGAA
ncbi:MOSC domain-containing protein [Candidatus Poriferisodalis sp.]|uniref:MOSC domain-containing protein n=1 Tax=Candidatus Poriferisodalis sp. TaxID=3101277 RepID=UPI003AF7F3F0